MLIAAPTFLAQPTTAPARSGAVEPSVRLSGGADASTGNRTGPKDRVDLSAGARDAMGEPLSKEEQKQIDELKKRDQEVRNHEEAHQRVGGQYASAPSYDYQQGPDGKNYAVGGQVQIDTAPVAGDPDATIAKMDIVKRAALAPAEPSGQDRAVAAQADATAQQARQEKMDMERETTTAAARGEAPPGVGEAGGPARTPAPPASTGAPSATLGGEGGYGPPGASIVGGLLQLFA